MKPHIHDIYFALCACRVYCCRSEEKWKMEIREENFHGLCHILLCFEGVLRSLEILRAFFLFLLCWKLKKKILHKFSFRSSSLSLDTLTHSHSWKLFKCPWYDDDGDVGKFMEIYELAIFIRKSKNFMLPRIPRIHHSVCSWTRFSFFNENFRLAR